MYLYKMHIYKCIILYCHKIFKKIFKKYQIPYNLF